LGILVRESFIIFILSLLHRPQVDIPTVFTTETGLPCHLPQDVAIDEVSLYSWFWCCSSSEPNSGKLAGVGVRVEVFFHHFFDILKVAFHSHFEMLLLRVSNVDLVCHIAGDHVYDDQNSAYASILTVDWSSVSSAVTIPHFDIHQLYMVGEFL
jgi:hypothetical protein